MFLEKFSKMQEIVQIEAKEVGLKKKMLRTNKIKKKLNNLSKKIKKNVEKYINNDNVT